mgnify:CR=1 FL=1
MATGSLGKPVLQIVNGIRRYTPQEYTLVHNATTDWVTSDAGDLYKITVTTATHGLGITPEIACYLDTGAGFVNILPDSINVATNGDVVIKVSQLTVDGRYSGRLQISRF